RLSASTITAPASSMLSTNLAPVGPAAWAHLPHGAISKCVAGEDRDNKGDMMTRWIAAPLVASSILLTAVACSKLDQKECDKIRGDAFEMLNKAQHCAVDADCRQSEWPGCAKPLSNQTFDELKPMAAAYKKGQCEEPKLDCKAAPEVYCKQGLCVHR